MNTLKVDLIAAARPNFMKVAPVYHAMVRDGRFEPRLIHTGQHYDKNMSDTFLQELGLPNPHIHLGVGSGPHGRQTANCLMAYEQVLFDSPPDWVLVVGDVNSTVACALAASKLLVRVAHLEAGLRSFDRTMPEEINRLLTDQLADVLWTHSPEADENLVREGVAPGRIERVGNVMIDSLEMERSRIEGLEHWKTLGLQPKQYGVVTLHRPANVDDQPTLSTLVETLVQHSTRIPLVFPVHPRTQNRLMEFGLWDRLAKAPGIRITQPVGYSAFMSLVMACQLVITDSGGIQEETTYLRIPCLTLRPNTERPVTVTLGTNRLVKAEELTERLHDIQQGRWPSGQIPEGWDGHAAERVVHSLARHAGLSPKA